jgi:hypothetical protein
MAAAAVTCPVASSTDQPQAHATGLFEEADISAS